MRFIVFFAFVNDCMLLKHDISGMSPAHMILMTENNTLTNTSTTRPNLESINVMSGRKKLDKKDKFNYLGFEFIIIYFVMLYTCTDGLST